MRSYPVATRAAVALRMEDCDPASGTLSFPTLNPQLRRNVRLSDRAASDMQAWLLRRGRSPGPLLVTIQSLDTGRLERLNRTTMMAWVRNRRRGWREPLDPERVLDRVRALVRAR